MGLEAELARCAALVARLGWELDQSRWTVFMARTDDMGLVETRPVASVVGLRRAAETVLAYRSDHVAPRYRGKWVYGIRPA